MATNKSEPVQVPTSVRTVQIKDRKVQAALRNLRKLRTEISDRQDRAKDLERTIKQAMGEAEEATVAGVKVATYKTTIRSSLSATLVKKAYPEVAQECTVMSEVRTFKLVDVE